MSEEKNDPKNEIEKLKEELNEWKQELMMEMKSGLKSLENEKVASPPLETSTEITEIPVNPPPTEEPPHEEPPKKSFLNQVLDFL